MYENECGAKAQGALVGGGLYIDDRGSKTVEENIDLKIASLQREIQRLEESKTSLAPLLKMKIRDVREAMSY